MLDGNALINLRHSKAFFLKKGSVEKKGLAVLCSIVELIIYHVTLTLHVNEIFIVLCVFAWGRTGHCLSVRDEKTTEEDVRASLSMLQQSWRVPHVVELVEQDRRREEAEAGGRSSEEEKKKR